MIKINGKWQEQVLIKWQQLSEEETTWESYEDMKTQYPQFALEDKDIFKGRGNDTSNRKKGMTTN